MASRAVLKKLEPITKPVFLPPVPPSPRFPKIPSQKFEVEVQTHQSVPLSPEQFAIWTQLPTDNRPFSKKFPKFAKSIISDLPGQLCKHTIGENTKTTNNLSHFQAVDSRWARMEEDINKLKEKLNEQATINEDLKAHSTTINKELKAHSTTINEELKAHSTELKAHSTKIDENFKYCITLGEMYTVIDVITNLLHSRSLVDQHQKSRTGDTDASKSVTENYLHEKSKAKAARNLIVHTLELQPSLLIVETVPAMEVFFDALFGLPSAEAKKLLQFDKSHIFHVETILSQHSLLWKSGIANKFIKPYRQWLEAMRKLFLLSQSQPEDASSTAAADIAQTLAEEACFTAEADLAHAEHYKLTSPHNVRKYLNSKEGDSSTSQYHWDDVLTDWKDRELLERLMTECD